MPNPEYSVETGAEPTTILIVEGRLDPFAPLTELHLQDGRIISLPTALLDQKSGGTAEATPIGSADEQVTLPIVEERLEVSRRVVPTATVRLRKSVQEFETSLNEPLAVRTFDIERVILNQPVDAAPEVRVDGETTVYPLVEEQLVLTKQLILREEVRVTRRDTERLDTRVVTLRREHLVVEREPTAK